MKSCRFLSLFAAALASTAIFTTPLSAESAIKTGDRLAFLGDSITAQGAGSPGGYVRLVIKGLEVAGQKVEMIPAGVGGNTSKDMLARLNDSVLKKKPTWMTLSCGVNDVWHGKTGVELEPYKANIRSIVDQAQANGIKVVLLTSTMIGEDQPNANNQKLIAYNKFLHQLAKEENLPLADLNADMQAAVKERAGKVKGNTLTVDGVHMNAVGNQMMAAGILKAIGFSAAELEKAREAWNQIPDAALITGKVGISTPQFVRLTEIAAQQHITADELVSKAVTKAVDSLLGESAGK